MELERKKSPKHPPRKVKVRLTKPTLAAKVTNRYPNLKRTTASLVTSKPVSKTIPCRPPHDKISPKGREWICGRTLRIESDEKSSKRLFKIEPPLPTTIRKSVKVVSRPIQRTESS